MDKKHFEGILQGMEEALAYSKGAIPAGTVTHHVQVPEEVNIKSIRAQLGMTQKQFSQIFGFPLATLKKWETGTRRPERAARVLLRTIACNPGAVLAANATPAIT